MAKLTTEEKDKRIELASTEIAVRIAKAYLRDDIDDEDVQYLFNTDGFEELNEDGFIENVDAKEPEGIGAVGFTMRTSKPSGNKNFITTGSGGWNTCIKGYPTDSGANVLANCVGYASGRFNEIINIARDTAKCTYTGLNCNAENFVERAVSAGLKTGSTPKRGAIMCWMKGSTLSGSDGAGHVAIVERVDSNNQVLTSESGYGSTAFWNQIRSNSNGRWGIGAGYTFRCFIYLPDDVQKAIDGNPLTPNVQRDENKDQIEVLVIDLRIRSGAGTNKNILGFASKGFYNYTDKAEANGYTWYKIAEGQWIASNNGWTNVLPHKSEPQPIIEWPKVHIVIKEDTLSGIAKKYYGNGDAAHYNFIAKANGITNPNIIHTGQKLTIPEYKALPTPTPAPIPQPIGLQIGDKVKIIGTGNGSSYGTSNTAYGIGWTRQVLKIWDGRPYPYQIGNSTGTIGFYKAEALQKK